MTGHEKRGYIYSAISFCINPIWGLVQGAFNFGYSRWADKQQGLDTLAPEYWVPDLGIAVQVAPQYNGKVHITSDKINMGRGSKQYPISATKEEIYMAVSRGDWVPIHSNQSRA